MTMRTSVGSFDAIHEDVSDAPKRIEEILDQLFKLEWDFRCANRHKEARLLEQAFAHVCELKYKLGLVGKLFS